MDELRQLRVLRRKGDRILGRQPAPDPFDGNVILPQTKIQDQYDLKAFCRYRADSGPLAEGPLLAVSRLWAKF